MIRWYHAIISAYGFWLPNDPRGSWSDFVYAWELYRFGEGATKVAAKRSHAHDPHDVAFRRSAKKRLKYPPARLDDVCRRSIASGFARACHEFGFVIHACAIGFDHVHLVTSRDATRDIESVVAVLKARATSQMKNDGTHPMRGCANTKGVTPTPWSEGCWKVFIQAPEQLQAPIHYDQRHPLKEGMSEQSWSFVRPFSREHAPAVIQNTREQAPG